MFTYCVLGLGFHQLGQHSYLMVSTTMAVTSYNLTDNDKRVRTSYMYSVHLHCSNFPSKLAIRIG